MSRIPIIVNGIPEKEYTIRILVSATGNFSRCIYLMGDLTGGIM